MGSDLAFGPKKGGINLGVAGTGLRRKVPICMHTHAVGASRASQMHPCPYQWSVRGFNGLKLYLVSGDDYLSSWDGLWEFYC